MYVLEIEVVRREKGVTVTVRF